MNKISHKQEKRSDKVSNDLYFYAWDRHKEKNIYWVFQDDEIRTTTYSRARSMPSMKNVTATEWITMYASHILFKSMPAGELEKWITWTNIKLKWDGKLLTNEK